MDRVTGQTAVRLARRSRRRSRRRGRRHLPQHGSGGGLFVPGAAFSGSSNGRQPLGRSSPRLRGDRGLGRKLDRSRPRRRMAREHPARRRLPSARSARPRVGVVGLRLGATLAAAELARGGPVDDLVLWDPCATGRSFLREQIAFAAFRRQLAVEWGSRAEGQGAGVASDARRRVGRGSGRRVLRCHGSRPRAAGGGMERPQPRLAGARADPRRPQDRARRGEAPHHARRRVLRDQPGRRRSSRSSP